MNPEPILYSLSHFREIILAAFDLAGVKRFVEVGSEYGASTEQFCDYARRVGGQLITIDPAPQEAARALIATHTGKPYFRFIESTSLEALPALGDVDAYIIDGDHNYYTVRNELEEIAKVRGNRPWLVFAHDVCWPSGRRDMYFVPERIPAEHRHAYTEKGGVVLDDPGIVPGGFGDGTGRHIALHEGGPRNGVRTAIEDFMAARPELCFEVIPVIFGVGVIYSRQAPWAEQVAALLKPFANSPLLERLERNRIQLSLRMLRQFHNEAQESQLPPKFLPGRYPLEVFAVQTKQQFDSLWSQRFGRTVREQESLIPPANEPFRLAGVCAVCRGETTFITDFSFASPGPQGRMIPAWRERQVCQCGLNCRQRSCLHLLAHSLGFTPHSAVLCTEQQGPFFKQMQRDFPRVIGCENLGNSVPRGKLNREGIRNENLARLTIPNTTLDCIISLDKLQFAPDCAAVLSEFKRCLKPGGRLLLTVPFHFDQEKTACRATVNPDGSLTHLLPPVYHANSFDPKGTLCINDFGWDLLDQLRYAGFSEVALQVFSAPHYGYTGLQFVIMATCEALAAGEPVGQRHSENGGDEDRLVVEGRTMACESKNDENHKKPNEQLVAKRMPMSRDPAAFIAPLAVGTSEDLCDKADELFRQHSWSEAEHCYKQLSGRLPDDLHVWHTRIQCLQHQGFEILASLVIEEALERHPEWAEQLKSQKVIAGSGEADSSRTRMVVGLLLATRFDKGYSHSFGPLGLGFLAASVRKYLPGVKVVMKERLEDLIPIKPDLVGISAQTENYSIAIQYAKRIKAELNVPVVIGGVHITMLPESLHEAFDAAVVGEGETTFVELLRSILENHGLQREALKSIPGLFFRDQGGFHRTAPRAPVKDLDALAPPILEELPFHRKSHMVCLVSARGCPYHCTFCISEKFSQRYRSLSSDRVADDVESWIRRKGVKHIVFYDDLLIANKKRVQGLIARLREKNLLGKCTFSCAVRANLIDGEMCGMLKELGVTDLGMGVESFSDRILKYYNKTGCTGEINQRAIDLLHAAGIKINPSIIFAAPFETRDDMLITLRKIFENLRDGKINAPTCCTLIPYPGTKVWDHALQRGIVSLDMDWDKFARVSSELYLCEEVSQAEFQELMIEWRTRISLLLWDHPEKGGSFVFCNRQEVKQHAERLAAIIRDRGGRELGDDLVLEFAERNELASMAGTPQALRQEADELFEEHSWVEATQRYKVLTNRFPDELLHWQRQVQCLQNQGFEVMANLILEEALERHPEWAAELKSASPDETSQDLLVVEGR